MIAATQVGATASAPKQARRTWLKWAITTRSTAKWRVVRAKVVDLPLIYHQFPGKFLVRIATKAMRLKK